MSLLLRPSQSELLSVGFNQDFSCFAVGAVDGFRIYNCDPFKETFRRNFSSGGIGMVEMLFRCNILALVGGGVSPRWPKHKVMVWDDHQNRCIGELSFRSEVKAVRLRRDRVVVALMNRVYVYNFADLTLVDHLETADNPRGLCAMCPAPASNVLACPGPVKGQVRVELYDTGARRTIAAHETPLACIALNATGSRLATASEKGTLIRIWDTVSGDLLQELRRGADPANICCIAFNSVSTLLACASDKGTVHIFKLGLPVADYGAEGGAAAAAAGAPPPAAGAGAEAAAAAAAGSKAAASGSAATAATFNLSSSSSSSSGSSAGSSSSSSSSSVGGEGSSGAGREGSTAAAAAGAAAPSGGGARGAGGAEAGSGAGHEESGGGGGGGGGGGSSSSSSSSSSSAFQMLRGALTGGVQKMLPKYFSSEWSFAQFRVPALLSICAFGSEPNTILVVCADGSFLKANFEKGGDAVRIAYAHFSQGAQAEE